MRWKYNARTEAAFCISTLIMLPQQSLPEKSKQEQYRRYSV